MIRPGGAFAALLLAGCGNGTTQAASPASDDSADVQLADDGPASDDAGDAGDASDATGDGRFPEDPIVFVHGYGLNGPWWDPALAYFRDAGYPDAWVRAISFSDPTGAVEKEATELETFVETTCNELGADRVDVVAHSMGGLASRYYVRFGKGKDRVRDYVSFAGAHHGSNDSCGVLTQGAIEMCPAYSLDPNSLQWKLNGDPNNEGAVDETPFGAEEGGGIHWNAFRSDGDLVLQPTDSGCLDQKSKGDCSAPLNVLFHGVLHIQMNSDPGMLAAAMHVLRLHNPKNP